MKRFVLLLALSAAGAQAGEAERVFAQVKEAVVSIDTQDEQGRPEGQGSGVVVAPGMIVTNCHVIEDAKRIRATWQGRAQEARLQRQDTAHDLCLLAVDGIQAKPVSLRKFAALRVGEAAYAVGNPLGLELSVSAGLVSGLPGGDGAMRVHTSAPVSPGSSGGGLFDAEGRLIGMTTGVYRYAQNFNTALPTDWVEQLLASKAALPPEPALPKPDPDWEAEGNRLSAARDWAGLRALAQRYLGAFPHAARAHVLLGVAADQSGDKSAALRHYQDALKVDPRFLMAWRNQAVTLISLQRYGDAAKAARKAIEIHDQDALVWGILGEAEYRAGNLDTARQALETAMRLFPGIAASWGLLGEINARQGRHDAAELAYRRVLRLNPNDAVTRTALAVLKRQSGQDVDTEALASVPSAPSLGAAPTVIAPGLPAPQGGVAGLLSLGEAELHNGRYAEAEQAWRQATEQDGNSAEAWTGLGTVQLTLGRVEEANASLRKAISLNPASAAAWTQLALAHTQAGRLREAEEAWWQVTRLNPGDAGAWMNLAGVRSQLGNYQGQNSAMKQAVALAPENAQAWAWLANARLRLGREDAVEAAERALKLDPRNIEAMNVLATFHGRKGQFDKALAYADKVVTLQPGDPIAWNSKGYAQLKLGKPDLAVKAFDTAIRLQPEFATSWINLGEARLRQGQMAQAIQALQKAIVLAPRAMDARLFLAEAYVSTLQPGAAREHLNLAAQVLPNNPLVWQRLVEMHLALGEKAEAQRALERLGRLDANAATKLRNRVEGKRRGGKGRPAAAGGGGLFHLGFRPQGLHIAAMDRKSNRLYKRASCKMHSRKIPDRTTRLNGYPESVLIKVKTSLVSDLA